MTYIIITFTYLIECYKQQHLLTWADHIFEPAEPENYKFVLKAMVTFKYTMTNFLFQI